MAKIKKLARELIDQIKAGEVVERPASVLKELVENSIDAGARRVFIDYAAGGIELLRIVDDGEGMAKEDLAMSIQQSATSKISMLSDLGELGSFGFRGEALAATASVSKLSISSTPRGSSQGSRIDVNGGEIKGPFPCGAREGTIVEVRDLFFNTPVRKKFLKSERSESAALAKVLYRFAFAYPDHGFEMSTQGKKKYSFHPGESVLERFEKIFAQRLFYFETESHGIRIKACLSPPHEHQASSTRTFVYVNGRFIKDRGISQALSRAYEGMIPPGRYPSAVLDLEMDPGEIDFNVHPQKLEVRFHEPSKIIGVTINRLREFLATSPWLNEISEKKDEITPNIELFSSGTQMTEDSTVKNSFSDSLTEKDYPKAPVLDFKYEYKPQSQTDWAMVEPKFTEGSNYHSSPSAENDLKSIEKIGFFQSLKFIGQVYKTYLIFIHPGQGLFLIDQHAAHERVVFMQIKRDIPKMIESKPLLFPVSFKLDEESYAIFETEAANLEKMGFKIESFGDFRIVVREIPKFLDNKRIEKLLRDVLAEFAEYGSESVFSDRLDHVCATMACHNSIRAGYEVSPTEAHTLLRQMDEIDFAANCPHGRPVFKQLGREELEKFFHRE